MSKNPRLLSEQEIVAVLRAYAGERGIKSRMAKTLYAQLSLLRVAKALALDINDTIKFESDQK